MCACVCVCVYVCNCEITKAHFTQSNRYYLPRRICLVSCQATNTTTTNHYIFTSFQWRYPDFKNIFLIHLLFLSPSILIYFIRTTIYIHIIIYNIPCNEVFIPTSFFFRKSWGSGGFGCGRDMLPWRLSGDDCGVIFFLNSLSFQCGGKWGRNQCCHIALD